MRDWIVLDRHHAARAQKERIRGVDVTVYMSPHNVPRAVRGITLAETGIFRIEFQYLDGSEHPLDTPRVSSDGVVTIYPGRHSGRIQRIDVKTQGSTNTVSLKIGVVEEAEKGLRELQTTEKTLSKRMNLGAAVEALHESRELIYT